ncbi:MAG: 3-oxoadipate enol-lactonase 2 [Planctomycetes bacterium]|nr:3-oxoadipate enol-lactonase 2 [Planctomycetota bacterium]
MSTGAPSAPVRPSFAGIVRVRTGLDIYVERHGERGRPPVMLLMGTGADHSLWNAQVEAYTREFELVVIDSRGTGRSTRPDDPRTCTPRAMAEDALGVLDALGIGRVHLGGLSLGSAVAQEAALLEPDRLLSLSLHGAWARSDEWFRRCIDTLEYPAARGDVKAYLRAGLMWVLSPHFLATEPPAVADIERTYVDENPHPPSGPGICGHTHADKMHDTLDRLPSIRVRTLVTAGEMDIITPPRYGEVVARSIPGARYHLFRGPLSSHCACIEMADEWNRVTLAFLRGDAVGEVLG